MPYSITTKDGITIQNIPDDVPSDSPDLKARVQAIRGGAQSPEAQTAPVKPASVSAGEAIMDLPRQVGLTARAGVKGLAGIPSMMADAVTGVYNAGADAAQGKGAGFRFKPTMQALDDGMTAIGIPAPQNANERVVGDMSSMVLGAGGLVKAAEVAGRGAGAVAKEVLSRMAARPGMQAAAAAVAGGAGGAVREAGGGPGAQFAASLGGGLIGGIASDKATGAANALKQALTPTPAKMQAADVQISMVLQRSGVDWSQVPERIKQGMRAEVAQALNSGQPLNADALRRLLVFRSTNTTPTVGQLTQDPGLITREKNLSRTAANSTDQSLQTLPALENRNTAQLLSQLDEAGAGRNVSLSQGGGSAVNSLAGLQTRTQNEIGALYNAARGTDGRSLPLEGGTFTRRASELIDEAMAGDSLPMAVQNRLNAIASGTYPLTVASAEALKTRIGQLQRGNPDGTARHALGLVRQALDETPLQGSQRVNPGGQPAVPGTVPPSTMAGEESIAAFNQARAANRQWMQMVERNPALQAVVDGMDPDQFLSRFVIGRGASAAEVNRLSDMLDPQAVQQVRASLVKYLRDAATGGDSDIVKFGGSSYRNALRAIDDKLPAFFSGEEIAQLRNVGNAAKYMQAQPAGSAVNNSNSGALVLGRGADMLSSLASRAPLGLSDTLTGTIQGLQQRQVLNPQNALIRLGGAGPQPIRINPLLAGSLVAPPVKGREDDRRN